jgi:hypothetical protein
MRLAAASNAARLKAGQGSPRGGGVMQEIRFDTILALLG